MGLFDKFRKKVKVIADEANTEDLTESRDDAKQEITHTPIIHNELKNIHIASKPIESPTNKATEWDEWDSEEEEDTEDPWKKLSKKERKKLKKEIKKQVRISYPKQNQKAPR